jgi:uncharacterized protein
VVREPRAAEAESANVASQNQMKLWPIFAMPSIFKNNRTALVTGASSGIGREIVRHLAPHTETLIIVARRVERMQSLAKELGTAHPHVRVVVEECDLSNTQAISAVGRRLEAIGLEVDILVNNAGFGENTLFETSDWNRTRQIIDVNVTAVVQLTHALVSGMVRRGHGAVLNIGSGAGHAAMPNAAVYTGSKHFIRAFSESLRAQLKGTGVTVCEAAPGPVKTDFDQIAGIGGEAIPGQSLLRITAAQCARDIVRGLERGTAVIYPGRTYRWLMRLQSLMPRRLIIWQITKCARELKTRVRA